MTPENDAWELSRRDFVKTAGLAGGAVALGLPVFPGESFAAPEVPESGPVVPTPVEFTVNGQRHSLSLDARISLLDVLRENLALTGAKKGCDHGQCGACTVIVNGRRILSCLSLAVTHQGDEITTIEGIANGDELHPVQAAFIEYDGFQCGYCTPGQICSAVALLKELESAGAQGELAADDIRERMSGNICRCGAYPGIVQAVQAAHHQTKKLTENRGQK